MDVSKLKPNPTKIHAALYKTDDKRIITRTGCAIYLPANYTAKGLATLGEKVRSLGVFMIALEDGSYGVSIATAMMNLTPTTIDAETLWGTDYLKLTFAPGSQVIESTSLIKEKKLTNAVVDYFIDYGHCPKFMTYVQHAEILSRTGYFNDLNLGSHQAIRDIVVAGVSRSDKDIREYYRHSLVSDSQLSQAPRRVPLRDIGLNTTSNLARLNGSELMVGMKTALLSKPTRSEPLEELLIK